MALTSELIEVFSRSFGRPVNKTLTELTPEERLLLGKLLFEETAEYCVKGLGLDFAMKPHTSASDCDRITDDFELRIRTFGGKDVGVDPIECLDGLADVNVVIHFNAHWQGLPLDRATEIVNDSNMSKLDEAGEPIINGVTPGHRDGPPNGVNWGPEGGFDPNKPIGKILKGPNFWEPKEKLKKLLGLTCEDEGCPHFGTPHAHKES